MASMTKPSAPHRARKRFGQNFLHDTGIINRIISAIHPKPSEHLVEIGPGQGALPEYLVASGCQTVTPLFALEPKGDSLKLPLMGQLSGLMSIRSAVPAR